MAVPSAVPLRLQALIKAILQLQVDAFSAINFLESKYGSDTLEEGEKTVMRCFWLFRLQTSHPASILMG